MTTLQQSIQRMRNQVSQSTEGQRIKEGDSNLKWNNLWVLLSHGTLVGLLLLTLIFVVPPILDFYTDIGGPLHWAVAVLQRASHVIRYYLVFWLATLTILLCLDSWIYRVVYVTKGPRVAFFWVGGGQLLLLVSYVWCLILLMIALTVTVRFVNGWAVTV